VDEFAETLRLALEMPEEEQERRMRRMRQQVVDNNIYRWAGMLLSHAGRLLEARHALVSDKLNSVVNDKLGPLSLVEVSS